MQPAPTFDTWTAGFGVAVVMGFFLFIILLSIRSRKIAPIAFFILSFSLILLQYVLYWTGYQRVFPYLIYFPAVAYYATGPLLYLYVLRLYKKRFLGHFLWHFIPSGLAGLAWVSFSFSILNGASNPNPWFPQIQHHWLIAIHMGIYLFLCGRIWFFNRQIATEVAKIRYRWAAVLLILYTLFLTAYISYYVLVQFSFFNSEWDYAISAMMTISIYTIGYFIFKQPKVFDGEFYASLFVPKPDKDKSFEDQLLDELYQNVCRYMEREKPFLENELRLADLADRTNFTTHLLSKVINEKAATNFNNFVNGYRLTEAEKLLETEPQRSIKSIYFEVGFNSKAAFYKAFKEKHHTTPIAYRTKVTVQKKPIR
ncbi:helix-turn-helix domain-containing protein [Luteirhabdus pelagi]|uniref:helix-turn-helix domain-containing protein n=1 Tax=Luteirhabdus pelagi TaxID=2792783 RepID=UPI001939E37C|nr:AraC family transcriptional regulator [Luteirhabdus pelagi]